MERWRSYVAKTGLGWRLIYLIVVGLLILAGANSNPEDAPYFFGAGIALFVLAGT